MIKMFIVPTIVLVLVLTSFLPVLRAEQKALSVAEFRQLYDSLLSGKTLVSETKEGNVVVKKERRFYPPLETGDGEFEVLSTISVTKTVDGKLEQRTSIDVQDWVDDLGGQALIHEAYRRITVETPGAETRTTKEVEFGGSFRVAGNEKGGFDVNSFGLIPSILANGDSVSLAGTMVQYSCYPDKGISKCVLTLRDYKLGDYEPLVGYKLAEPAGGDYVEVMEEVRQ